MHNILKDFESLTNHIILNERRDLNKKKITCDLVDFIISRDRSMNIKEKGIIDKFFDIVRELRNLKVTVIPTDVGALETVPNFPGKDISN